MDDFVDLPSPQEPDTHEVTPEATYEATPKSRLLELQTRYPPTSGEDTVHTPAATPVVMGPVPSLYRFRDRLLWTLIPQGGISAKWGGV